MRVGLVLSVLFGVVASKGFIGNIGGFFLVFVADLLVMLLLLFLMGS